MCGKIALDFKEDIMDYRRRLAIMRMMCLDLDGSIINYFEAQVACINSKCEYIGPDNCNDEYEKSVLFTLSNDDDPQRCNYAKCQLRDSVTADYKLCVSTSTASSSASFSFSSFCFWLYIIMLIVSF